MASMRAIVSTIALSSLLAACSSSVNPGLPSAPSAPRGERLYVADESAHAVYVFSLAATGIAAPDAAIAGPATTLDSPNSVAVDDVGNIYVAQYKDVLEFAAGSSGDVAPIKTINSPEPGYSQLTGIAVDKARNVYVADYALGAIWIYGQTQSGSATPNAFINTTGRPWGVAVDTAGTVYASLNNDPSAVGSIAEWQAGHTGNAAPDNSIKGLVAPTGLSVAGGMIYVIDGAAAYAFAQNATGMATPLRSISGPATTFDRLIPGFWPRGIAADSSGKIYVADAQVPVFAAGSTGNVAPLKMLTRPTGSVGVAVH